MNFPLIAKPQQFLKTIVKKSENRGHQATKPVKQVLPKRYRDLPYKEGRYIQLNDQSFLLNLIKDGRIEDAKRIAFEDEKHIIVEYENASQHAIDMAIEAINGELATLL